MTFVFVACALSLVTACERERIDEVAAVPVRTEVARRTDFVPTMTLLGVIRAAQSIPMTAQQRGVVSYPPRFATGLKTGVKVSPGELLATVQNDEVRSQQTQARLQMESAAADYDRARRSYAVGVLSSAELDRARAQDSLAKEAFQAASKRVATLRVVAPAAGTLVVTRLYPPGTMVDASAVLGEIASSGAPLVESSVAASERQLLHPGLPVRFIGRGSPAWNGGGTVVEVAGVIAESGTSRVVAAIDPNNSMPPPGAGVELHVQLDRRAGVLTLPEEAIVAGSEGAAVFVAATSEGRFNRFRVKRIAVETGGRANGVVEIISGLHDGDRVVVSGADALTDDAVAAEVAAKGGV
jgi:RND family efflux transporter MFP subunit